LHEIACNCYWPLYGTIAVGAYVPLAAIDLYDLTSQTLTVIHCAIAVSITTFPVSIKSYV